MTKSAKPKTIKEWEKVCKNLNDALESSIETEEELNDEIDNLLEQIEKLEEQLTMSVGVIKYLELKIGRPNSVRSN
jgi:predicted  nucleic acid-binding Zn-ribbon protein